MIQFREGFFSLIASPGHRAAASQVVSNRHHSPLAHCPALPVPACRLEACLARPLHTSRALHVCYVCYVHTLLCHLFYAYPA